MKKIIGLLVMLSLMSVVLAQTPEEQTIIDSYLYCERNGHVFIGSGTGGNGIVCPLSIQGDNLQYCVAIQYSDGNIVSHEKVSVAVGKNFQNDFKLFGCYLSFHATTTTSITTTSTTTSTTSGIITTTTQFPQIPETKSFWAEFNDFLKVIFDFIIGLLIRTPEPTTTTTTIPRTGIAYICRGSECSPQEQGWMEFSRALGYTVVGKSDQSWSTNELRNYRMAMFGPGASSVESDTLQSVHRNYGINILELVDRPKNGRDLGYVNYVCEQGINSAIILSNHEITQGFQVGDFFIVNQGFDDPYRCYATSYSGTVLTSKGTNRNKASVIAYESPNGRYVWIPFIPVVMSPYGPSGPTSESEMFIQNAIRWTMG